MEYLEGSAMQYMLKIKGFKSTKNPSHNSTIISVLSSSPPQADCHHDAVWKNKEAAETWFSHSARLALKQRHPLTASSTRCLINAALGALPEDGEEMHFVLFEHWNQGMSVFKIMARLKDSCPPKCPRKFKRSWSCTGQGGRKDHLPRALSLIGFMMLASEMSTHLPTKRQQSITVSKCILPLCHSSQRDVTTSTQGWKAALGGWKITAPRTCFCLSQG